MVTGGDFNAKSPTWGSTNTDNRGLPENHFARGSACFVYNVGSPPIFGPRGLVLHIYVTFACPAVCVEDWSVLDRFSDSDHDYIFFGVSDCARLIIPTLAPAIRWSPRRLEKPAA